MSRTAEQIAAAPWACVVSDRRAVYDGLGLGVADALVRLLGDLGARAEILGEVAKRIDERKPEPATETEIEQPA